MKLTSTAFKNGDSIPTSHTCEGDNRSPPLAFEDVPPAAKSLVLIVDDPDAPDPRAPKRTWAHWLVYNLPPTTSELAEAVSHFPAGTLLGQNDWKHPTYGGPCPPIGRHRYFHKLYALDSVLPELHEPTRAELQAAMQGHVIAEAELMGTYQKQK